ncbi:hypothetical protein DIPPA_15625 [Diplonema papillatum]|nr:hypothetical protein DIPPA_15625 [Diplonema papillatum]
MTMASVPVALVGLVLLGVGLVCGVASVVVFYSSDPVVGLLWEVVLISIGAVMTSGYISERRKRIAIASLDGQQYCGTAAEPSAVPPRKAAADAFRDEGLLPPSLARAWAAAEVLLRAALAPKQQQRQQQQQRQHASQAQPDAGAPGGISKNSAPQEPSSATELTPAASSAEHPPPAAVPRKDGKKKASGFRKCYPLGSSARGVRVHAVLSKNGEMLAGKYLETDDEASRSRMLREVRILEQLKHPNVVSIINSKLERHRPVFYEELGDQGTLRNLVTTLGSIPVWALRYFSRQVLAGLSHVHSRDVIHRDIKAGTILLFARGVVKLAGFGEACYASDPQDPFNPADASLGGRVYWLAPEVVHGGPFCKGSDLWAFGCTLVEMLAGRPPYAQSYADPDAEGAKEAFLRMRQGMANGEVPAGDDSECGRILSRCFALSPGDRATADELLRKPWFDAQHSDDETSADGGGGGGDFPSAQYYPLGDKGKSSATSQSSHRRAPRQHAFPPVSVGPYSAGSLASSEEVVDISLSSLVVACRILGLVRPNVSLTPATLAARGTVLPRKP